jgi:predicted RNA polymerase sigma factor
VTATDAHRAIDAVWRIEVPRGAELAARLSSVLEEPARARTAQETDWARIAAPYAALAQLLPTPVVELNRAVALAMAFGPAAGLEFVETLTWEPSLKGDHLLPSVRGDLLAKLGRLDEARAEFERAAALTHNARERGLPLERMAACAGGT